LGNQNTNSDKGSRSKNFDERLHQREGATSPKNCPFSWGIPHLIDGSLGVHIPNDISTGSAVLAQLMAVTNKHIQKHTDTGKLPQTKGH